MLFSGIPFLCYFLMGVLGLYYLAPRRLKNPLLLLASLFFYFYGEPLYCLVMVASALVGYIFGLLIHRAPSPEKKKAALAGSVVCCLAPLLFFKYSDFFIANVNALTGSGLKLLGLALPIGISFYTFQILSYTIDVYRGSARVQKTPVDFLTYVTLFPQLIAGPIVRYSTVQDELESRSHSLRDLSAGVVRFTTGLGKKVLIANSLAELAAALAGAESVLACWLRALAYTYQIYFDFSGYSDMAIGLGRMFGFHFNENFDHPFMSQSVTEFWRRWHMSLGSWFRDYVYIPLGGNRCSRRRWAFNVLVVWFLTGFWHGAAWNFIVWGMYFALLLMLEKLFLAPLLEKLPRLLRMAYVMLLVVISFVIFNAESMKEAALALADMFSFAALPLTDSVTHYHLAGNALLLAVSVVGATPLPAKAVEKLRGSALGGTLTALSAPLYVSAVLLVVIAYLVDGSFNPFLYFRF